MSFRCALTYLLILATAALTAARSDGAAPAIQFCGSRPARPVEPPWIPLPENKPLTIIQADSVIQGKVESFEWPRNRYEIFDVDLDGDGAPERIAQIARITAMGYYSQCWWGVYSGGARSQILYWFYPEERVMISSFPRPKTFRDAADSLGFESSKPEFYPAVDVLACGDITGDGKSEIAVWMLGRSAQTSSVRTFMAVVILSPGPEGLAMVFRGNLLWTSRTDVPWGKSGTPTSSATAYRLRTRVTRSGGARDLLLEPWMPMSADSLCMAGWLDEREIPHDPDKWMPIAAIGPQDSIPGDWMISRWEDGRYGGFQFVKDVTLK